MFRTAQAVFEADVARKGDLKNHIALRRLRQTDRAQDESHRQRERAIEQRERQLELAREKFEFDAAAAVLDHLAEVREIAADRSLRHPAKIQAVRRRLFGDPPPPGDRRRRRSATTQARRSSRRRDRPRSRGFDKPRSVHPCLRPRERLPPSDFCRPTHASCHAPHIALR